MSDNIVMPKAKKIPFEIVQHGQKRVDNYHWMRDKNWKKFIEGNFEFDDPDLKEYLDDENSYTDKMMKGTEALQKKLYSEILGRINENESTYPEKMGDYYYYSQDVEGKNYKTICRRIGSVDGEKELIMDVNVEAANHELFVLGRQTPSPDNKYFAYCYNTTGSMERTIKVRDLETKNDLDWKIPDTNGSYIWGNDSKHLYYVLRNPENSRGDKVYIVNIDQGPSSAKLIFEKPTELGDTFMGIGKTTSKKFMVIEMVDSSSSQCYVMNLDDNNHNVQLVALLEKEVKYGLFHFEDKFYILTNDKGAVNFKIMCADENSLAKNNWQTLIEERSDIYIEDADIYAGKMILVTKNNAKGLEQLEVFDLKAKTTEIVKMPHDVYTFIFMGADDQNSEEVRFYYESPIQPAQTVDLNIKTGEQIVRKTKDVPHFRADLYEVKRVFAPGHDGEEIPLTLYYKKGLKRDGGNNAFVYAYGSYGFAMPVYFSQSVFSLIDRGFVVATAHIRGGTEKGYKWYLDGKMKKKKNTFKDYISCCEYLINEKYTSKGQIVANGGSAGGLLMGAVANMRPDMFGAVVANVAFVDMINTISDSSLPLTPPEWEEWGNPIKNKDEFEYMMSYSPYDNVESKDYPPMLYTSGISDEQVTYWEPTKMIAKLREMKTDNNLTLLRMKMHAGHAGASKKYEWIEDQAFEFSFMLKCCDIKE